MVYYLTVIWKLVDAINYQRIDSNTISQTVNFYNFILLLYTSYLENESIHICTYSHHIYQQLNLYGKYFGLCLYNHTIAHLTFWHSAVRWVDWELFFYCLFTPHTIKHILNGGCKGGVMDKMVAPISMAWLHCLIGVGCSPWLGTSLK